MTKSKKIIGCALSAAILLIIILLAVFPDRYAECCLNGLRLWLYFVVPSLFPFFILTALLTKLGVAERAAQKLSPLCRSAFKMPGIASYCFAMSALSGYPVGSRLVADLHENGAITSAQATRMSALCSTSGPLFIIASVGAAMFKNQKTGIILLASHLLSVLLVCWIAARFQRDEPQTYAPARRMLTTTDNILYESVYGAVISILCVGAFISVFYILTQILTDFYLLLPLTALFTLLLAPVDPSGNTAAAFSQGLIEATRGCQLLSQCANAAAIPLTAFIITFGGLSILAQQITYFKKANVKIGYFIGMKLLQAAVAAGIGALLLYLF